MAKVLQTGLKQKNLSQLVNPDSELRVLEKEFLTFQAWTFQLGWPGMHWECGPVAEVR